MTKVVLIGAGSTSFSPSVVADMARSADFDGATLVLVDVDPTVLQIVTKVAQRIVRANNSRLTIEATTARREALPGAHFVITTFAVGGANSWIQDVEIPKAYGISMPVGDTVGPGGLSRALRHVPVLLGIARDMEELCPHAYLFNYTNPMTVLCRAVSKASSVRIAGLCVGPELTRQELAKFLGIPGDELEYHGGGFNHCFWILDARYRGNDVYALAREKAAGGDREARVDPQIAQLLQSNPPAERPPERMHSDRPWEYPEVHNLVPIEGQRQFVVELLDALGYYPGPQDRHVTEFFPDFFSHGSMADERYGLTKLPVRLIGERKSLLRGFLEEQADDRTPLDADLANGDIGHSEEVVDVIGSVVNNRGRLLYGNVPNNGLISNLPRHAVVEVPLVFGAYGWRAFGVGDLPESVMPYMARRAATIELFVEAAMSGDRTVALQALLADGWIHSISLAEKMLDELLEAQADYLPQFRPFTIATPTI